MDVSTTISRSRSSPSTGAGSTAARRRLRAAWWRRPRGGVACSVGGAGEAVLPPVGTCRWRRDERAPDRRTGRQTTEELRRRTCVPCPQARNAGLDRRRGPQADGNAQGAGTRARHHATGRADARLPPCSPSRTGRTGTNPRRAVTEAPCRPLRSARTTAATAAGDRAKRSASRHCSRARV